MSDLDNLAVMLEQLENDLQQAKEQITTRFLGQDHVVDLCLSAILGGGHALLVGVPGLGKTRLVDTLATVLGLDMSRIQFTPDLMPSDILGSEILKADKMGFEFLAGPIFCQLLMADEINRASPRTQSALLQAMQEQQVTIAGQTRALGQPFHVLATQNPLEQEGTYPLPEAQLDRFLLRIDIGYPDAATERAIVLATTGTVDAVPRAVFTPQTLLNAQNLIRRMPVGDDLMTTVLKLVRACRPDGPDAHPLARDHLVWGPGPRATQAFILAIRAHAAIKGRLSPTMADVMALAPAILSHRCSLRFSAQAAGVQMHDLIRDICLSTSKMDRAAE